MGRLDDLRSFPVVGRREEDSWSAAPVVHHGSLLDGRQGTIKGQRVIIVVVVLIVKVDDIIALLLTFTFRGIFRGDRRRRGIGKQGVSPGIR
jgi:hypothetical protein